MRHVPYFTIVALCLFFMFMWWQQTQLLERSRERTNKALSGWEDAIEKLEESVHTAKGWRDLYHECKGDTLVP